MTNSARTRTVEPPAVRCTHCNLPVPVALQRATTTAQFCCSGCEAVWNVLNQCGLEEYYRLRDAYGESGNRPASVSGKSFEYLDDPDFQKRAASGHTQGGLRFTFFLDGVHCTACSWLIEKVLVEREGAAYATLNLGKSVVDVIFDPSRVKLSALARALDRLGYTPHVLGNETLATSARRETRALIARMGIAGACAGNIMLLAVSSYFGEHSGMDAGVASLFRWISLGLALPAVTYSAWPFYRGAWNGIRHRALHMDLPISIGIIAAFAISLTATLLERGDVYFDSVSMLVFLLLAGRLILNRAGRWAADAGENLLRLEAKTARRLNDDGVPAVIPLEEVQINDKLQVLPSETVPVDGIVIAGSSYVLQAHLTGEAEPVFVEIGSTIFAGSIVTVAPFSMMATQVGESTRLHRLAGFMREAALRRAPLTVLTDRIAGYFVAAVLVLATATALFWLKHDPTKAWWNAAAMLVVTCPCALGLATPIALGVAMGRAARRGIYIKGADGVERLAGVRHVILDKTGTITEGHLTLRAFDVLPAQRAERETLLHEVAALEVQSGHLFARAFAHATRPSENVRDVKSLPGLGVRGTVNDRYFEVGSARYLMSLGYAIPEHWLALDPAAAVPQTCCFVARDHCVVARCLFSDREQPQSVTAIHALQAMNLSVELLSGDTHDAVAAAANTVKIAQFRGGVSPEEKLQRVRELEAAGQRTAMVGDGINDSAALSAATVGISVAGAAEIARDAADVFISGRGPDAVVDALRLSRRALRIVKINIGIGIAYNIIGATLAFSGLVSPLGAAILMPLSSLTVLIFAVRA